MSDALEEGCVMPFQSSSNDERECASSLLQLGTPERPRTPPACTSKSMTSSPPEKTFTLAGIKRHRSDPDLMTFFYDSEEGPISVPFMRGESPNCLFARRNEAARNLYAANRGDVYCTWRKSVVNMPIKDACWEVFRESSAQTRFKFKNIQLIMTRFTCTQWRDGDNCRNCSNRKWRTACLCPKFLYHVMPLPVFRDCHHLCEQCLTELDVTATMIDGTKWAHRIPQLHMR